MKPFSEQLSEYVQRVGVSDAELARRLGVSRQTIFRWREGSTHSPRHRPDVVRLAEALRLTAEERDQLLLAAGFRPEGSVSAAGVLPQQAGDRLRPAAPAGTAEGATGPVDPHGASAAPEDRALPGLPLRWIAAAALALLAALLAITGWWRLPFDRLPGNGPEPAAPGESLVLVAEFANYAGSGVGFNVQDRLAEALRAALDEAGLQATRIELLGETFGGTVQAAEAAARLGAEFVLWGEYDSGRVIAYLTGPGSAASSLGDEQRWSVSSLEQLSATVNVELPEQVRWMGLYGVGLAHFHAGQDEQAVAALNRLLAAPPEDPSTVAGLYFVLGVIEGRSSDPDLDRTIALYSEALDSSPGMVSALSNRGVAYLQRGAIGDLRRAEADFREAVAMAPEFAPAQYNLALALAEADAPDLEAIVELLLRAESLEPDKPHLQNALCWYLSLTGEPETALRHCEVAISLDSSGYSNDSYGLALALIGRPDEAAAQFGTFLDRLEQDDPEAYTAFEPSRSAWIERLQAGENPFDQSALQALIRGEMVP